MSTKPSAQALQQQVQWLTTLMQLEDELRSAQSAEQLHFTLVNRTHTILLYDQAVLLKAVHTDGAVMHVVAASNIAIPDRDAPLLRWLERLARQFVRIESESAIQCEVLDQARVAAFVPDLSWDEQAYTQWLWCPLRTAEGTWLGVLLLGRNRPWQEYDQTSIQHLGKTAAHAWQALLPRRRWSLRPRRWVLAMAVLLLLVVPVRQSVLAPAMVSPHQPIAVTAPLSAVIASFQVEPNQRVSAGQPLFRFDTTVLQGQVDIATQALAVVQAEYHNHQQAAFNERRGREQLQALQAQVALREAELDYHRTRLAETQVTALQAGVVVFGDANDWVGLPVETGEQILLLADPEQVELNIDMPVEDALILSSGAEARLFLDTAPLQPLKARLHYAAYQPQLTEAGVLAYRIKARFAEGQALPRIGLRGTAKLYGDQVPLAFYLLRRPLTWIRQFVGF